MPELVALGAIEPLDARLRGSPRSCRRDYFAGALRRNNVIDGRTWGVPWYADTRLLFYRSDLLREAGFAGAAADWAGWLAAMRAIKARAAPGDYAILLPVNEYEPLLALAPAAAGAAAARRRPLRQFPLARLRPRLRFLSRACSARGSRRRVSNTQISNVYDEFARGHFAFYISGPWNIGEFKRRLPPERQDDWMTAPLPGPTGPGASIAGGASLAVFARSERKEAAWKLVEYLSRPDVQLRFFELTGDLPARRSVWRAPVLAERPLRRRLPRPARARRAAARRCPNGSGSAQQLRIVAERAVAGQLDRRPRSARRWTPMPTACSRGGAGCWRAGAGA